MTRALSVGMQWNLSHIVECENAKILFWKDFETYFRRLSTEEIRFTEKDRGFENSSSNITLC